MHVLGYLYENNVYVILTYYEKGGTKKRTVGDDERAPSKVDEETGVS